MKITLVLTVVIVLFIAVNAQQRCDNPGEKFPSKDGCNRCKCNQSGVLTCTKMLCNRRAKRMAKNVPCKPGSSFLSADGCNKCKCSADGKHAACTKKFCIPGKSDIPCKPGTRFLSVDGCNRCICSKDGKTAACTKKKCPKLRPKRKIEKECEPGTQWAEDCNTCVCSSTGIAICTRMGC